MRKVAYISHGSEFGGGERSLQLLINGLRDETMDYQPVLIVPFEGPLSEWAINASIATYFHEISESTSHSKRTIIKKLCWWLRVFRSERISMIHANDPSAARLCAHAAKILNIPVVCHFRFIQSPDYYKWIFKYIPKPKYLITVSNHSKAQLVRMLPDFNEKASLTVLYNAVDTSLFHAEIRKPTRPFKIGIVANLQAIKGHEDFLRMAKSLLEKGGDYEFHVFGSDVQNQNRDSFLKQYSTDLNIGQAVFFHGHVDDVASAMRSIDLVVCPSYEEPFGRTVIEAMACGKVVVAYAVGGIVEIIEDNETGFLVEKADVDALTACCYTILSTPEKYTDVANKALTRVSDTFSAKAYVKSNVAIYNKILLENFNDTK